MFLEITYNQYQTGLQFLKTWPVESVEKLMAWKNFNFKVPENLIIAPSLRTTSKDFTQKMLFFSSGNLFDSLVVRWYFLGFILSITHTVFQDENMLSLKVLIYKLNGFIDTIFLCDVFTYHFNSFSHCSIILYF